jgi:hypothetical protein
MKEKEILIKNMKIELEKYYIEDVNSIKEIFIADPDKINLELYNELNYTRDIMAKISKMLNTEKAKNIKYEENIRVNFILTQI